MSRINAQRFIGQNVLTGIERHIYLLGVQVIDRVNDDEVKIIGLQNRPRVGRGVIQSKLPR